MFTIDDGEEVRQEDDEGYYYDEVFGHSAFRDQRTNSSVRELVNDQEEEEVLDLDFETLGIKMDDYKIDPNSGSQFTMSNMTQYS